MNWRVFVGLAGLVAEEIRKAEFEPWEFEESLRDGMLAYDLSVSDAALIGDEWTPFLAAVYDCCRTRWQYRIPAAPADRARLRSICARTLAFENSFLQRYRDFLLAELAAADPAAPQQAVAILGRVPWPHPAIRAALRALTAGDDATLRQAALTALSRLEESSP